MSIAKQSVIITSLNWGLLPLNILTSVLIARTIGPEGVGILALLTAAVSLLSSVGSFGLGDSFVYAIFAECPVLWTGMNASGEVRGGDAIPSLAQCREAALLSKSERKLRRFAPRCPDLWSGSFTKKLDSDSGVERHLIYRRRTRLL